ncbi:MAG TPA: hypothetical protein VGH44_04780 [Candidatus Saccharimonadia bacterium]|jgi:hypothetical protein
MPYDENERDLDYEQSMYEEDPAYGADTYFAERLDQNPADETAGDESLEDEPEPLEEDYTSEFGEKVVTDEPAEASAGSSEYADETEETKDDKLK